MKKISSIFIREQNVSATFANTYNNSLLATPSIPAHFDGWAFSIDGLLYKTFTNTDSQTVQFDSSASSQQKVYLRGLRIINNEEILDDKIVEKNVTIFSGDGNALFFNGGFAYTMPSKPNGSYSQSEGGGLSGFVNSFTTPKGCLSFWIKPMNIPSTHSIKTSPDSGNMFLFSRRHDNNYTAVANWYLAFNFNKGLRFYQYSTGSGTSSVNQYFGGNIIENEWNHIVVTCFGRYVRQPQYGTQAHVKYSDLKFYVNGSQVGSKTIRQMRDHRTASMMIGSWHSTYSNGYDTGHTRAGASGVNYSQFWRAIPSAHSNTDTRFYGLMKGLLSTENSVPNATQVNTLYQDGLEGLLDSGYNPVRTYWEMDEVKTNGSVHGLTLGQYVDGVTARRGSNYNKASKIVLSSGVTGI